ncbi:carbohydrate ABC transporter permease [Paenibacillus endoradicis]|uniref:carbohydrate ABC transporter permease n=1 Tax=Paenibacillus endoradicis TaxID=2972487 RepID=UPI002158A93A|nr:carbohydrate ABC transporter permease [Paenibacillus endoradicis]MCR8657504.1 carbohydrate ABC transporter permease [Paenibacillus endoradicis]
MKASNNLIMVNRKKRFDIWDVLINIFVVMTSLACLLPLVHTLAKSLSKDAYVLANKVMLWPLGFNFDAYGKVLGDASILRSLYVSVVVTIAFTILGMIITICAAYPLSRKQLKGRKFLSFIFLITLYFSGGIIPEYMLINQLGLLDTMWALILPQAFSAFNFLIMRSAIASSIPVSLEESARIDGAGHFRVLFNIVLPLSKPIIATLSLFYAVGRWNAYQDAMFYIKMNTDLRPLQLKLYYMVVEASESFQLEATMVQVTNPDVLKAACVIFATVPIVCIYPFIQKYFVSGQMLGAVKE